MNIYILEYYPNMRIFLVPFKISSLHSTHAPKPIHAFVIEDIAYPDLSGNRNPIKSKFI